MLAESRIGKWNTGVKWVYENLIQLDESILRFSFWPKQLTQSAITCSKLAIETLEQGAKYVQS